MNAQVIDGRACARSLKKDLAADVARLREDGLGIGLATVSVGDAEVIATVTELNEDPCVSGILVLRPLPSHVDEPTVFRAIDPRKDIEAVHPENAGLLAADRTTGIGRHTRWADVLIVAAGKPGLIKAEHVSENAIVIDVGINPRQGPDGRVQILEAS